MTTKSSSPKLLVTLTGFVQCNSTVITLMQMHKSMRVGWFLKNQVHLYLHPQGCWLRGTDRWMKLWARVWDALYQDMIWGSLMPWSERSICWTVSITEKLKALLRKKKQKTKWKHNPTNKRTKNKWSHLMNLKTRKQINLGMKGSLIT